jgi:hypothetical protein
MRLIVRRADELLCDKDGKTRRDLIIPPLNDDEEIEQNSSRRGGHRWRHRALAFVPSPLSPAHGHVMVGDQADGARPIGVTSLMGFGIRPAVGPPRHHHGDLRVADMSL